MLSFVFLTLPMPLIGCTVLDKCFRMDSLVGQCIGNEPREGNVF